MAAALKQEQEQPPATGPKISRAEPVDWLVIVGSAGALVQLLLLAAARKRRTLAALLLLIALPMSSCARRDGYS